MYGTVIIKELLSNILSLRYALVFFLFVALTTVATVIRAEVYRKQVVDHREATSERRKVMDQGITNPREAEDALSLTVDKEPNPLGIFVWGLENEMTRSFGLSDERAPVTGPRKLGAAAFQYALQLDMLLVINVVCSLLALLLMFDAVCGEREAGTLKVLLAGPLPRDVVIGGKLIAGLVTVLVPLALSWAASLVYVLVIAKVALSPEQFVRLSWIIVLSVLYIMLFFALGMAVSCWVQRSATSLAVCLFFWIMAVLAVPNLTPMIVRHLSPIPPQSKIMIEKEAVERYIREILIPQLRDELSSSGQYATMDALSDEISRRANDEQMKQEDQIDRFHNGRVIAQLRLNQQLTRVSPSAAYVFASTHLAGTGVQDFRGLLSAVDQYKRECVAARQAMRQTRDRRFRERGGDAQAQARTQVKVAWPEFRWRSPSVGAALNESWIDIALLAAATVMFFLLSFVGFVRYNVQ